MRVAMAAAVSAVTAEGMEARERPEVGVVRAAKEQPVVGKRQPEVRN